MVHPRLHSPELAARFVHGPNVIQFHVVMNPKPSSRVRKNPLKYRQQIGEVCSAVGLRYITSFGHAEDTIDSYPKLNENGVWLRLAVGYAPDADLHLKMRGFLIGIRPMMGKMNER